MTLVFGFGGFYMLVRILPKPEMGAWALFVSVTTVVEVARGGFVKYGFIKFRSGASPEDQRKIFSASLVLNVLFALVISIGFLSSGGYLASAWKTPELKPMFFLYSVTSLVLVPFFQLEYLQQSLMDFKRIFFAYFIRGSFLFFAILFGFFGFYSINLTRLAILNLVASLIGSLAFLGIVQKPIPFAKRIDMPVFWKLVHFGKYVLGTSLGSTLYGAVDQFILGSIVSTASVAVYGAASRITNLVNTPSTSLSVIIFPQSAKVIHSEGKRGIKALYEKSVGAILGIALPGVLVVLLFNTTIVTLIAGEQYLDAVPILNISIFVCFFVPFAHQFGVTLNAIGYPHTNFYFTVSLCLINLTVNYFLILSYGITGAALGTLGTTFLGFSAMQLYLHYLIGINLINIFKNLIGFYGGMLKVVFKFFAKGSETNEKN